MLSCSFAARPPKPVLPRVHSLLTLANEKLWVGYFVASAEGNELMFRHSLLIRDGAGTNKQHLQDLLLTQSLTALEHLLAGDGQDVGAVGAGGWPSRRLSHQVLLICLNQVRLVSEHAGRERPGFIAACIERCQG